MTPTQAMRFAILQFPASNCDQDCVHALRVLGAQAKLVWHKDTTLGEVDAVIVPGGFSYGDALRCGAIARFSPVMQAVSRFADTQKLEPLSGGVFLPTADEAPIAAAGGSVMQGYIEGSNISPMREMIDLVSIARAYEANQKIISTRDQLLQRTLDTLG